VIFLEAYEGTDNMSRSRSAACIALYPVGNATGSWVVWKLEMRVRVRRTNVQKLMTSQQMISTMNALAQEYEENQRQPTLPEVIIQQGNRNPETAEADLEEKTEADPEEIAEANPDVRSDPEGGMENNPETEMNPEVIGGNDALVNPKTNLEASMDDDLEAQTKSLHCSYQD
jgi:hypothetical protein